MKKKNLILSIIFFLLLVIITGYTILSKNDINTIISDLKLVSIGYLSVMFLLVFIYFLTQGIYMKILLKSLDVNISLIKCTYYSIVEFFFSGITPSATGGQPIQLYYMSKDDIPMDKSFIVIILSTIYFKLYLLFMGILILIFKSDLIFGNGIIIGICFWLGLLVDVLMVIGCYLMMFKMSLIKKIFVFFNKILVKMTKGKRDYSKRMDKILKKYVKEAEYIKSHTLEIIVSLIATFIQRTSIFSILYVICLALGYNNISYFNLLLIQVFVQITIEVLPFPGGTGAIEKIIKELYVALFGTLATAGMILYRTISFYIPLLIILIIITFVTKGYYSKKQ